VSNDKRKPGRPALPPEQRQTERVEMRCTKAQREKLGRLGGVQWVRDQIDKAKEPPDDVPHLVALADKLARKRAKEKL